MTSNQIKYILTQKGYGNKIKEWTTLISGDNGIGVFNLTSDVNILVEPTSVQFYFDTDNDLLYIRKYYGKPTLVKDDLHTIPVSINDKVYYYAPIPNQIEGSTVGYFSDCISFKHICAIYDKKHSCYRNY